MYVPTLGVYVTMGLRVEPVSVPWTTLPVLDQVRKEMESCAREMGNVYVVNASVVTIRKILGNSVNSVW